MPPQLQLSSAPITLTLLLYWACMWLMGNWSFGPSSRAPNPWLSLTPPRARKPPQLGKIHADGLFEGVCRQRKQPFNYRLRASRGTDTWAFEDAYRFGPLLGEMDEYLLGEGSHHRAYERLGAHVLEHTGVPGTSFAVWAPGGAAGSRWSVISTTGDGRRHPMRSRGHTGIWEIFVPNVGDGVAYKYEIKAGNGEILPLKSDPFGFGAEVPPKTASVVRDIGAFTWTDSDWLSRRTAANDRTAPISIYEVHAGSVAPDGKRLAA